jgi:hypothetical protein
MKKRIFKNTKSKKKNPKKIYIKKDETKSFLRDKLC